MLNNTAIVLPLKLLRIKIFIDWLNPKLSNSEQNFHISGNYVKTFCFFEMTGSELFHKTLE